MNKNYVYLGSMVLYSMLEYWLGKTKKVKPNSVVELIGASCILICIIIKWKAEKWRKKQE